VKHKSIFIVVGVVLAAVVVFGADAPSVATFEDSRDGKTYKKVKIGNQTWMAENLNYDIPKDKKDGCYENNDDNCDKYGRLYNFGQAKKVCPAGWRLPTAEDWDALIKNAGGPSTAGEKLQSAEFGFLALPGGRAMPNFVDGGNKGYWWSITEVDNVTTMGLTVTSGSSEAGGTGLFQMQRCSVRCIQK